LQPGGAKRVSNGQALHVHPELMAMVQQGNLGARGARTRTPQNGNARAARMGQVDRPHAASRANRSYSRPHRAARLPYEDDTSHSRKTQVLRATTPARIARSTPTPEVSAPCLQTIDRALEPEEAGLLR
jgi:hypothetical protein